MSRPLVIVEGEACVAVPVSEWAQLGERITALERLMVVAADDPASTAVMFDRIVGPEVWP